MHSYGKIYALGSQVANKHLAGLWPNEVLVQEKIDGSQFCFGNEGGKLFIRSKNQVFDGTVEVPSLFKKSVATVTEAFERGDLPEGFIFHGEAMCAPRHNTLEYARAPKGNIVLFDVEYISGLFCGPASTRGWAETIGCEAAQVFTDETGNDLESFLRSLLDRPSMLGGRMEGVVVKAYHRADPFDPDKPLKVKLVSEAFKEIHHKDWKERNPNKKDALAGIVDSFATPARWDKAIQSLRDQGLLKGDPSDIGSLMEAVRRDVEEEAVEDIKEALWQSFRKNVLKGVVAGVPAYYKSRLADGVAAA